MSHPHLSELKSLLRDFESTQAEHLQLMARKRPALRAAQTEQILQIAQAEEGLMGRMQELLTRRQRMIRLFPATASLPEATSLIDVALRVGGAEGPRLVERVERVRKTSATIQRENRIHWIIAQSAYHACGSLIEILTHRGKVPPLYGKGAPKSNGLFLDKTA